MVPAKGHRRARHRRHRRADHRAARPCRRGVRPPRPDDRFARRSARRGDRRARLSRRDPCAGLAVGARGRATTTADVRRPPHGVTNMATSSAHLVTARGDATSGDLTLLLARCAFWGIVAAKLITGWGVQWDIEWHVRVGRDSFWIAPHVITYAGVSASVLLSWGMLAWYTVRGVAAGGVQVLGIRGTRGFHLAAWGNALTVAAAPIDDLWHRLFGLDVTLWSPPHLLGILGGLVSAAACLGIAREVYPGQRVLRWLGMVLAGVPLYRGLALVTQPAFLLAHAHGGLWFHAPAILSSILLPQALVATAMASGRRSSPVVVVLAALAAAAVGQIIADAGFDVVQPVSVIDE